MGFVFDMVTGEVSNEDATKTQYESKKNKVIEYSDLEYGESLAHISECPSPEVEKSYIPDHLVNVNLDEFFDDVDRAGE